MIKTKYFAKIMKGYDELHEVEAQIKKLENSMKASGFQNQINALNSKIKERNSIPFSDYLKQPKIQLQLRHKYTDRYDIRRSWRSMKNNSRSHVEMAMRNYIKYSRSLQKNSQYNQSVVARLTRIAETAYMKVNKARQENWQVFYKYNPVTHPQKIAKMKVERYRLEKLEKDRKLFVTEQIKDMQAKLAERKKAIFRSAMWLEKSEKERMVDDLTNEIVNEELGVRSLERSISLNEQMEAQGKFYKIFCEELAVKCKEDEEYIAKNYRTKSSNELAQEQANMDMRGFQSMTDYYQSFRKST